MIKELDFKELWNKIEGLRGKLHNIVRRNGMTSPETIRISQQLDNMMNQYSRLQSELTSNRAVIRDQEGQ